MKEWAAWMANKMDEHLFALERLRLPEYISYLEDRRRFYRTQFVAGILRGVGSAIGFTILGAVLVWLLQGLAQRNLPVIGDFLAEIVSLVQRRLE
ncbi:MAG: hypothetical protein IJ438_01265 [Clostridia bacterium]|nr:hypothetical protein [Clostridia bacterium]